MLNLFALLSFSLIFSSKIISLKKKSNKFSYSFFNSFLYKSNTFLIKVKNNFRTKIISFLKMIDNFLISSKRIFILSAEISFIKKLKISLIINSFLLNNSCLLLFVNIFCNILYKMILVNGCFNKKEKLFFESKNKICKIQFILISDKTLNES